MRKVGERVGAIRSIEKDCLYYYGFGVYVGDELPSPEWQRPNPKIVLDEIDENGNNKVVWGFECWWASEAHVKKQIEESFAKGKMVAKLDIDQERLYAAGLIDRMEAEVEVFANDPDDAVAKAQEMIGLNVTKVKEVFRR